MPLRLFTKVVEALERQKTIEINYRTPCEVEVDAEAIPKLKKKLP